MEFFNAEDAEITPRAQRFISYFLCVLCANSAFYAFNRPPAKHSPFQER